MVREGGCQCFVITPENRLDKLQKAMYPELRFYFFFVLSQLADSFEEYF
jgi:hypothetical protein